TTRSARAGVTSAVVLQSWTWRVHISASTFVSLRRRARVGPPWCTSSQYLVNLVNRSVRTGFTNADRDDAIQECVFLGRGLQSRQRSKVIAGGIDGFSTAERRNCSRRPVAQPLKPHINQRMIVSLERNAQVELQNAVGAQQQPVPTPRQNLAAESRA